MRRLRFYCEELRTGCVQLDADESHHARDVMRARVGDAVELFDGEGRTAPATITASNSGGVTAAVEQVDQSAATRDSKLTLITALPRRPRQPFLFEKCAELSVARLVLVNCERSTVKAAAKAVPRWRRWSIEAAKQCGAIYLPRIETAVSVVESIDIVEAAATRFVGDPRASCTLAARLADRAGDAAVWIGPEGGLSDVEHACLTDRGVEPVRLGPYILRIETACLTVAAIYQAGAFGVSEQGS